MSLLRNALFAGGTVSGLVYWAKQNFQKTIVEDKKNIEDQKDRLTKKTQEIVVAALDEKQTHKQAEKPVNSVVIKLMQNDPVASKLNEMLIATHGNSNADKNPSIKTSVFHHNIFHYTYPESIQKFIYMGGIDTLVYFKKEVLNRNFVKCVFQTQKPPFDENYESLIMETRDPAKCYQLKDMLQEPNAFADDIEFERKRREYKTR